MATAVKKKTLKEWSYQISILVGCSILLEKGESFVNFLFKNGVLAYQKGDLMIVPLLPHHMQFRWAGIIIGIIGSFIIGWTIYKSFKHGDYNEYINLLMLFILITLMLWFLTLSALSVPLFIPVFILALIVPTALTFYFTYATIRAVWMTIINA